MTGAADATKVSAPHLACVPRGTHSVQTIPASAALPLSLNATSSKIAQAYCQTVQKSSTFDAQMALAPALMKTVLRK